MTHLAYGTLISEILNDKTIVGKGTLLFRVTSVGLICGVDSENGFGIAF